MTTEEIGAMVYHPRSVTVREIYKTDKPSIPEGFEIVNFREVVEGDYWLATYSAMQESPQVSTWNTNLRVDGPRLILHKKQPSKHRVFRAVRVLEYIGPEKWIETTFKNNGVGASGYTSNAYGCKCAIRELSVLMEEVK